MFSGVRSRMSYANVVATLALVFAMSGGAYAASKFLITSTKQIKPSVLASLKGAAGKAGPAGAAGAQGAAGPQGPAGPGGAQGVKGENGVAGKEGPQGPAGKEGKEGKAGLTGFTETLPSGKTEKGTWAVFEYGIAKEEVPIKVALSFPIPLASASNKAFIFTEHQVAKKEFGTSGCSGTLAMPVAPAGTLCVFTGNERLNQTKLSTESGPVENFFGGTGYEPTGALIRYETTENASSATPGEVRAEGTFAVTAP